MTTDKVSSHIEGFEMTGDLDVKTAYKTKFEGIPINIIEFELSSDPIPKIPESELL